MKKKLLQFEKEVRAFAEERALALGLTEQGKNLKVTVTRQDNFPLAEVKVGTLGIVLTDSGQELKKRLGLRYNPEVLILKIDQWSNTGKPVALSERMRIVFWKMNLVDFGQVVQLNVYTAATAPNVGPKSFRDLVMFLRSLNLELGMKLPPEVLEWYKANR